ncbi:PQQ-binding-like beta-propeller repeat protein (plasmid) [Embleya sp. NBC_00888]|uniref:outer membrane protein assembly factor BamB family protein n=1 Tax=Embleya sp. NBC_00888 TaxID=2975960 RepID=UPI002F918779|nr:PQQ-binding-like beta-propeller repeat protein [Embleya sp. NBC_00888]
MTVELRDAVTGARHATVEMAGKPVATTWHGRPALLTQTVRTTPSDGISPEKQVWQVDVLDEKGQRIAHREYPDRDKPFIVDGRRVVTEKGKGSNPGALVISDAGSDAPGWRIPCQDQACLDDDATVAHGVVVHHRRDSRTGIHKAETLAGFDAATGAVLWTPQNLARPAGAAATAEPDLVKQQSGKLVIGWYTLSPDTVAYSVNDPTTGRLLATGPTLSGTPKSGLSDTRGTIVVVATTTTTAAWETDTGRLLWQQAKDEVRLDPVAVVGPVLYSGEKPPMAVDLRTKAVLQRTVSAMPRPVGTDHAVVTPTSGTAYVFATRQD